MHDVIDKKTNHVNVDTFSSLQTVKFDLGVRNVSSTYRSRRRDLLRSPIN